MSSSPPSKRVKHDRLFKIETSQPSSLKLLAENISHVIKTVEIHIVSEDDFEGIRVETLDDLKVCLVIAQLPCSVVTSEEWKSREVQSISLSVEWLLVYLRQIDIQYTLVIEQFSGEEDIVKVRSFEPLTGHDELSAEMHALVPLNKGTITLKEFPVQFKIEMDLQTVRSFLKTCESIKSDDVELIVKEHCDQTDQSTVETVTMKASDKATMALQRTFRGIKSGEDSDLGTLDEGKVIFHELFATRYLNNFVRSMQRTNIMFHMSPRNPLHVSYPLGTRDATITFILAPREMDQ